ncbi:MAG UNVERIFIED_CONTAM: hypothetical protein LVR29_02740 [Microcystis novacekii LVE1205-3]
MVRQPVHTSTGSCGSGGVFVTLSILTAILRLVSAVLSALILAAIFYLIYRYILKPKF